jgi:hypothetical protein
VRDLVRQWTRRDPADQGIAVVAENESRTGTTFALTGTGADRSASGADLGFQGVRSSSAPDVEPFLELYVR